MKHEDKAAVIFVCVALSIFCLAFAYCLYSDRQAHGMCIDTDRVSTRD